MGDEGESSASSNLRQTLMTAGEVYVYKIPPLKNAGGHRAEDWNLSKPLKTCHLKVERRGDALVLEFTSADDGQLFCQSQVDLTAQDIKIESWLEQVVDSSRYFVVKIQGAGGREALVGFGFRDREKATDLRESIQHYEKSVKRETQASKLTDYTIPKMGKGEKIHVNRGGGKSTITKSGGGGSGDAAAPKGVPLLKKKPPSSPVSEEPKKESVENAVGKLSISMEGIDIGADHAAATSGDQSDASSSGGAVYLGDEEQWATEFAMK